LEIAVGLDMYAYAAAKAYDHTSESQSRELAYWRKHPNLHGWMEQLWRSKGGQDSSADPTFNGVELELTWQDLDDLEQAIESGQLPYTRGFFFGDPSDNYYKEQDLAFARNARAELFTGLKVFYNSSW
jgi:hypothetical protein